MRRRRWPADESGMTLIEIMIALVILSVIVVGVMALLATLVRASDVANRKTEAEALAITAADYLKAEDFDYGLADDCQAHYAGLLTAYTAAYPSPGYTATVTVYRGDATSLASGGEIPDTAPAAGSVCLDGNTPAIRLAVAVAADDGRVTRTQDVVLRCSPAAAEPTGVKCLP